MSIEQLRTDMEESSARLAELASNPLTTSAEVLVFIRDTMWPTMVAAVDEMAEIDSCVEDLLNNHEDVLQPETASLFGALVVAGRALVLELKNRLRPDEHELRKAVAAFEELAKSAEVAIEEITIPPDDEADAPDDEDEDEED